MIRPNFPEPIARAHHPVRFTHHGTRLFWEYDDDIRRDPPLAVAVPKITLLGDLPDIQWLIRRFGREAIRDWMYSVRVVGADRKSVHMMCVAVGADATRVRHSPDWIGK